MLKYRNFIEFVRGIFVYNKMAFLSLAVVSLIVAGVIWDASKKHYDSIVTNKFETALNENMDMIKKRISRYEGALQSGVGFFLGSYYVNREDWYHFTQALNIKKNYPGMQGIGFSKMLLPDEVNKIELEMQKGGYTSFFVKPAGIRKQYSSILYLEPMDKRNLEAIGYDMFSEPTRRKAMETARDTGLATISGKVTLVQEIDSDVQAGMLMYIPLYKKEAKTDTLKEKKEALTGFIYSPFRMNDLMRKIVRESLVLNFEIYDNKNLSQDTLLYRSFEPSSYISKYHALKELNLNNHTWYIHFYSTKKFDESTDSSYPLLITTTGLSIQLFLVLIIFMLFKSRELLKEQANELLKLSQALEQSPSNIIITNLNGDIEYVNKAFCVSTGYSKDEVIGKNPRLLQSKKTEQKLYIDMWSNLTNKKIWHGEFINKAKNGTEYIESVHAAPIFKEDGTISNYVAIQDDITEKKHSEEQIYYLANFDSLTGLPNRFKLKERIKETLHDAKRNNEIFTVIFLDLDYFKDINDTLGHDAGDFLLIELSNRFKSILRKVDTVSRLGGDEFIFVLPNTNADGASHIAQKLINIANKPIKFKENKLLVTASIGIAIYPKDGENQETLFRNADYAMYKAKQNGRNKYCFF